MAMAAASAVAGNFSDTHTPTTPTQHKHTVKAINICVDNASIRELLTEIAAQSGQAGWIAHIKPEELKTKEPFWKGVPMNEHGASPITGHWQFFALVE